MIHVPPDFDWVKALGECSSSNMFQTLRLLAKRDVETRNTQLGRDAFGFRDNEHEPDMFMVWAKDSNRRHAVDFHLKGAGITIARGETTITLTLTLDQNGACKCRIGNGEPEELDPWQVLKKALEPLLF